MVNPVALPVSLDLRDRTLWFDGDSSMSSERIAEFILQGKNIEHIFPLEVDSAVKKYNLYADKQMSLKGDILPLSTAYTIPQEYKAIDLPAYIFKKLSQHISESGDTFTDADIENRIARVKLELELFEKYEMTELIKTAIYIVDKFEENEIVWGTGRGSSCACYSLYLIGIHEVDSVLYDLDLNEFFR